MPCAVLRSSFVRLRGILVVAKISLVLLRVVQVYWGEVRLDERIGKARLRKLFDRFGTALHEVSLMIGWASILAMVDKSTQDCCICYDSFFLSFFLVPGNINKISSIENVFLLVGKYIPLMKWVEKSHFIVENACEIYTYADFKPATTFAIFVRQLQ